ALDLALAAQHRAVIADLHQNARRDLRPMQAERDLVVAIVPARHGQGEVVEDALAEAMADREAMRRREVDPRLPFRGIDGAPLTLPFNQSHLGSPLVIVAATEAKQSPGRLCCVAPRVNDRPYAHPSTVAAK